MRWEHSTARAAYDAAASGETMKSIAHRLGCSRNGVIGALYRLTRRDDLPRVADHRASRFVPPPPPKPRPPAAAAKVPAVKREKVKAVAAVVRKPRRESGVGTRRWSPMAERSAVPLRAKPTCEAVLCDGSPCGREVHLDAVCLGHLFESGRVRLRPPARRITSGAVLAAEIERTVPIHLAHNHRYRRDGLAGLSGGQISADLGRGHVERIAKRLGWERVDEHEYRQVAA